MSSISDNIRVVVRTRPIPSSDVAMGASSVVRMQEKSCVVDGAGVGERRFAFDRCFWSVDVNDADFASQRDIFEEIGRPVLDCAWQGYNCSIFAYGQTGSGKTFTMMGGDDNANEDAMALTGSNGTVYDSDESSDAGGPDGAGGCDLAGLIPRVCHQLFARLAQLEQQQRQKIVAGTNVAVTSTIAKDSQQSYKVSASYMEIYNEAVRDLLADGDLNSVADASGAQAIGVPLESGSAQQLRVREHPRKGPYVEGLTCFEVGSFLDVQELLHRGPSAAQ